jgi:hypothetical protein
MMPDDDEGYITLIESFLVNGEWYLETYNMHAPRVPGQNISYLFCRIFLPQTMAINLLLIAQVTVWCVAVFAFLKELATRTSSRNVFFIGLLIAALENQTSVFNNFPALAESFANAYFILSLTFFSKVLYSTTRKNILLTGLFFAMSAFFKVVVFPISILFGIVFILFLWREKKFALKKVATSVLIFAAPFIAFESIWVVRNYVATDKVILTQEVTGKIFDTSFSPTDNAFVSGMNLIRAFGGTYVYWDPDGPMAWFNDKKLCKKIGSENPVLEDVFPEYLFSERFTKDDLILARFYWWKSKEEGLPQFEKDLYVKKTCLIINGGKQIFKEDHPFYYHVYSYVYRADDFFFHTVTYMIPFGFSDVGIPLKLYKILSLILYYLLFFGGLCSVVISFFRRNEVSFLLHLITAVCLYYLILYVGVLKTSELRYSNIIYLLLSLHVFANMGSIKSTFSVIMNRLKRKTLVKN